MLSGLLMISRQLKAAVAHILNICCITYSNYSYFETPLNDDNSLASDRNWMKAISFFPVLPAAVEDHLWGRYSGGPPVRPPATVEDHRWGHLQKWRTTCEAACWSGGPPVRLTATVGDHLWGDLLQWTNTCEATYWSGGPPGRLPAAVEDHLGGCLLRWKTTWAATMMFSDTLIAVAQQAHPTEVIATASIRNQGSVMWVY